MPLAFYSAFGSAGAGADDTEGAWGLVNTVGTVGQYQNAPVWGQNEERVLADGRVQFVTYNELGLHIHVPQYVSVTSD